MSASATAIMMIERRVKFQTKEEGHIIQFTVG